MAIRTDKTANESLGNGKSRKWAFLKKKRENENMQNWYIWNKKWKWALWQREMEWKRRSRAPKFSQLGKEMLPLPDYLGRMQLQGNILSRCALFCCVLSCVAEAPRLMRRAVRSDYLTDVRDAKMPLEFLKLTDTFWQKKTNNFKNPWKDLPCKGVANISLFIFNPVLLFPFQIWRHLIVVVGLVGGWWGGIGLTMVSGLSLVPTTPLLSLLCTPDPTHTMCTP